MLAACILSALSGSAVADAAALSALLVPMMVAGRPQQGEVGRADRRVRHHRPGDPALIGFVIFGVAAGLSISKLFLAGIFPGILIAIALAIAWWWEVRKDEPRAAAAQVVQGRR